MTQKVGDSREGVALPFEVLVDDNYRYMDESARRSAGMYETWEQAVEACKEIVERSLRECHETGMTGAELFGRYRMFGEDPFVRPAPDTQSFSAWSYAQIRCEEICGGATEV